ncbi:MAG TPA: carbon-nitrogen hydrolase family protein [Bacteroidales bacterium]|nr:carbon-nitrogen hydrolase family protein [Bacteroidales bacterium]HBQ83454.1 carbon-nitrogen hydrolase family protein [Bacteroidales bacterium]HCU19270.1 carbon-nitrogen hydrolase family protein [Bacteroidales bacterium]
MKTKSFYIISLLWLLAIPTQADSGRIRIASCQFPVSADVMSNYRFIESQMIEAKLKKADVVHFPECALSGYPGSDFQTLDNFNWDELHRLTDSVILLADKLNMFVILGSLHKLSGANKPHNSLYVITPDGKIADRYDKRFCTSTDLKFSSPGDHFVSFSISGVKCGLLICYDIRYPELYREYRKLGCDVIFQSFYNARAEKGSIHPVIMPVSAQAHAATNYFYMSLTNSSAPESWPCHFLTPDGLIQNKLPYNAPGILISDIDLSAKYYDASREYRPDAMNGKLNSGTTLRDTLSSRRNIIY